MRRPPSSIRRGANRAIVVAIFGVLVLANGGCGGEPGTPRETPSSTPVPGGTLVIALEEEPEHLIPYGPTSATNSDVLGFLFRMLADTDATFLDYTPSVARSWEWSSDRRTLTFHLRDDVTWSDGVPVTAEDVVFTNEIAADSLVNWSSRHWKSYITAVRALDPYTVAFEFKEVFRDQFRYAKESFLVPRHLLADVPRDAWARSDFARHPVGCGPFVFESWEAGQRIVLRRNERYFETGKPYLERVVLEFIPDPTVRLQRLRAGLVDVVEGLEPRDAAQIRQAAQRGTGELQVFSARGRLYDQIAWNLNEPLFQERRVREALTRAIDRQAIIDGLCYGFAELFEGPIVPMLWAWDSTMALTPYDPEGARRLLEATGWTDSDGDGWRDQGGRRFEFTLLVNNNNPLRRAASVPIQRDLKQVGVKMNVQFLEPQATRDLRLSRRYQAYYGGWSTNVSVNLQPVWGCDARRSFNYIDYCNPRVDSLNALGVAALDPREAIPYFHEAQRLVAHDYPYTWLYYKHDIVGTSGRLRGIHVDARGTFINMESWWIPRPMQRHHGGGADAHP